MTACAALRESVSRRSTTVPRAIESSTWPTTSSAPICFARRSRKSITSS
ncbi:hypothetical protein M218_04865 [Burkholderia pseudomallei MSHR338]|nr:hypothetical protein M218_04865 [Burkholderia pseudomallei MSHR338]